MVRFPDDSHRHTIIGRTGSGKTQFGVWSLAHRSWHRMPWVILDYKRDALVNSIGAVDWDVRKGVPKYPGIYRAELLPDQSDDEVNAFMWACHAKGNVGLYADEGYMIPQGPPLRALLSQGRALRIPIVICTQRPVKLDRMIFSEAEFFTIFAVTDERDRKTIQEFAPINPNAKLPQYYSHFYDVGSDQLTVFKPVPPAERIVDIFNRRRATQKKVTKL